jgi:hypothetical protein
VAGAPHAPTTIPRNTLVIFPVSVVKSSREDQAG